MHIIAGGAQIARAAPFYDDGLVTSAKHVTKKLVPMIEPNGVGAQQPAHPVHEIGVGCFNHQVEMIAHQAIGMDLETGFRAGFGQRFEEIVAINIGFVDVLLAVATAHDVVDGAGILDSELSWHGPDDASAPAGSQPRKLQCYSLTPL